MLGDHPGYQRCTRAVHSQEYTTSIYWGLYKAFSASGRWPRNVGCRSSGFSNRAHGVLGTLMKLDIGCCAIGTLVATPPCI